MGGFFCPPLAGGRGVDNIRLSSTKLPKGLNDLIDNGDD